MSPNKNYVKVYLNALLIFACVFFQRCNDHDTVTPQQRDAVTANSDVLQKIKSLGFTANQIKETPNYYLADGDLYFSKKISSNTTAPVKKSGHRILEKYATLTIHLNESLAGVIDEDWRAGMDQAIEEWNAKEDVHFHFSFTNSTEADINIIKDTDLPQDLAIASEFPRDSRTGSSIRINVAAKKAVGDPKQAFAHALEHCMGFTHSMSAKNQDVKININALKNARGPRFEADGELYAIQGDILYRISSETGEWFAVDGGWTGTEVMSSWNSWLYMVQFGTLWKVNPADGTWTPLTSGWGGSQYIASTYDDGRLYIMQDSWIWPVDPATGLWDTSLGSYTLARGMASVADGNLKYDLAVLRRKPGSQTVSLLYTIDQVTGAVLSNNTVPASGVADWNGTFLLTGSRSYYLQVLNGTFNWIIGSGPVLESRSLWPHATVAFSYGLATWIVSDGTLYMLYHPGFVGGKYNIKQLGKLNDWAGTSCLIYLR